MIRRPPRSPLFPSPPLSRSAPRADDRDRAVAPDRVGERADVAGRDAGVAPRRDRRRRTGIEEDHRGRVLLLDHVDARSEEHTSELQSLAYLVCRLLLGKKK